MIQVTVLQDEEVFGTMWNGQLKLWTVMDGIPTPLAEGDLPPGDWRLKLHTKEPKSLRVVFEGESTIPDHQWYHIGIKGDPEAKGMITTNREGAKWLHDTFGEKI